MKEDSATLLLRDRMVDELARMGIGNHQVLEAMRQVPRHRFMDSAFTLQAYTNQPWTIGHKQTISQPYVVARMTELLVETGNTDKVLEIGTGSGYQAAILARLYRQVYTIERIDAIYTIARDRLNLCSRCRNVYTHFGDGTLGWPDQRYHPFNAIIYTAAATAIPHEMFDQLADPGILVAPIGDPAGLQHLYRFRKHQGRIQRDQLEETKFVPVVDGTSYT